MTSAEELFSRPRVRACAVFFALVLLSAPAGAGAPSGPAIPPAGRGASILRGGPGKEMAKPSPAAAPEAKAPAAAPAPSGAPTAPPGARGIASLVRTYGVWIVAALGLAIAGLIVWAIVDARRRGPGGAGALADLGFEAAPAAKGGSASSARRYSSTRIRKSDVVDRSGKSVTATEIETDREYALVVDEDALKLPPPPETPAEAPGATAAADPAKIRQLVDAKKYREAHAEYAKLVAGRSKTEIPADLEVGLAEGLLRLHEYAKAAAVLERHVGSRRGAQAKPETYFNLGYAEFMSRDFEKARRYFRQYVSLEPNPSLAERAKKVLEKLGN